MCLNAWRGPSSGLSWPLGLLAHYGVRLGACTCQLRLSVPQIKQSARGFELGDRLADLGNIYMFPPKSTETYMKKKSQKTKKRVVSGGPRAQREVPGDLVTVCLCPSPFHSRLHAQPMCGNPAEAARHAHSGCRFGICVQTLSKRGSPDVRRQ